MRNMHIKQNTLRLILIIGLFVGMVQSTIADAYRNPAPTAEGIAKSGAVMVFSDDASAISYNPANLADQTNASLVVSAAFAQSENTYTPPGGPSIISDDPVFVLPNLYYSMPVSDRVVAGIGLTTPYGQGVSWNPADLSPLAPVGVPVIYEAEMAVININPSVGVKISDSILVGAGLDIFYSQLDLKALLATGGPILDQAAETDGTGVGGNLALTWIPTQRQRVALTYRSRVDVDYEGDFTLDGAPAGNIEATVKFPNIIGAGYGFQITDTVQVEALIEWIEWSVNDVQYMYVNGVPNPIVNNWEDTITAAIGGSWAFAEKWVFRTGYSFIECPIPETTVAPSLPDTDRHILGIGLGYTIGGHTIDLSYSYTIYEDKTSPLGSVAPGTYEFDSNLIGLTYSYSF